MLPLPRPARVVVREGKTWPGEGAGGASGRRRTGFSIFGSPSLLHAAGIPVRSAGEEAWHRARLAASRARQPGRPMSRRHRGDVSTTAVEQTSGSLFARFETQLLCVERPGPLQILYRDPRRDLAVFKHSHRPPSYRVALDG